MSVLITIALIVVVAHLWSRLNKLQERVAELEQRGASGLFETANAEPEEFVREDQPSPLRIIRSEPLAEIAPREPDVEVTETEEIVEIDFPPDPESVADADGEKRQFGFEDIFGRRLPI